jgi:hypothetical protein
LKLNLKTQQFFAKIPKAVDPGKSGIPRNRLKAISGGLSIKTVR